MTRAVAIGIGCRKGCSADAIEGLVLRALDIYVRTGASVKPSFPRKRESIEPSSSCPSMDSRFRGNGDWRDGVPSPGLFTLIDKVDDAGLKDAATRLGLNLSYLSREALRARDADVQTRSQLAESLFGVPSVAEAAALAGAGPASVLIVPRIAEGGATCAIAEMAP